MNNVKQLVLSLALVVCVAPAIVAGGNDPVVKTWSETFGDYKNSAVEAFTSAKTKGTEAVKSAWNSHPRLAVAGLTTTAATIVLAALYKYNAKAKSTINSGVAKIKNAANAYVVDPIKSRLPEEMPTLTKKGKLAIAGTAATGVTAVVVYKKSDVISSGIKSAYQKAKAKAGF